MDEGQITYIKGCCTWLCEIKKEGGRNVADGHFAKLFNKKNEE